MTDSPPAPPRARAASQSSRPADRRPFQPGIDIDWQAPAVFVQGTVVLRAGPLEFFACFPGKEHESIVRLECRADHLYLALGLIVLEPRRPPHPDEPVERYGPSAGSLVDVRVARIDQPGAPQTPAFAWLREREYARAPLERPWVFSGSQRTQNGRLTADVTGAGVALVDFSDNLLSLTRSHTSRNADLWAEARTEAIPPRNTRIEVVFRPARAQTYRVDLDALGVLYVNGRYATSADAADLIRIALWLRPQNPQPIHVGGALRADVRRLREALLRLGIPGDRLQFVESGSADAHPASRATTSAAE